MKILKDLRHALDSISIYRGILEREPMKSFYKLAFAKKIPAAWCEFFNKLCESHGEGSFQTCINNMIKYDVNPFSIRCAGNEKITLEMKAAVCRELDILTNLNEISPKLLREVYGEKHKGNSFIKNLPLWNSCYVEQLTYDSLAEFYRKNGCGEFAQYHAFVWQNGGIVPVPYPDPIRLSQLKDYEYQRGLVIENTKAFLSGASANNCLLYGDRGTGKSSTVKAVLNEYKSCGLRLVEMPKKELHDFPELIKKLAVQPLKFIIFIDDLSFSSDDDSYASLKAVLEGGIASRPSNTLIYATTNRRHLIKENFSSRNGDDVHFSDTMQESLSLSDRFGLTVTFQTPDKKKFLGIVSAIAQDEGIEPTQELLEAAERFACERAVRSPRCARQYIDFVKSEIKM